QVQTDSGSLGDVIDGTQVRELPLNGRSFVELTQLVPGVAAANNFDSKNKGLQGGVDFSVNGNPTTNNLFLVDGANDNDVGSNRTILIYPSIESIAEFKMLTNSYGAEYGQASGAVISIVTRSGTNQFHGSAFYDGRNDALAAYTYFSHRNIGKGLPLDGKDKLRRNDWGYSIGGPIKKDKLFFFFNEEWNHEIRGFTQSACVATAAEIAGDFTTTSCGEPTPTFPTALRKNGNAHVLNATDPAGTLLADYYPLPNQATNGQGYNWSESLPTFLKWRQENVRIDYHVTPRNQIEGRYVQDTWTNPSYNGNQYWGDSPFPAINSSWAQPSKQIIGKVTSTITNSLVNDAEFAYSNNRINITPGGTNPGLLSQLNDAIPTLYPTSLKNNKSGSIPTIWSGLGNYGSNQNIWTIAPWNNSLDIYTFRDDISKVAGSHTIQAGFFLGWNAKDEDTSTSASEHPTFATADYQINTGAGGVQTGNNLANVLIPNNPFTLSETSTNIRAQLRWRDREFYAQDTWKARPKLTLNYGVRFSLLPPTYQPNGLETNFQGALYDPSKPASDACNGLLTVPGKDPCGDANKQFGTAFSSGTPYSNKYLQDTNYHLFAPRVGLAYDVRGDGKTAVRLGYGMFYQRERVSRYTLVANAPFAVTVSNYTRALGGATPATLGAGSASPAGGYDTSNTLPMSMQWNATVEQNLAKNTVLSISYVGNRGEHLTSSYDLNSIQPANYLTATFVPSGAVNGYRPYSNFGSLTYWTHNGDSYFEGLETLFRTQVGKFNLQAAYTWSKALTTVTGGDGQNGVFSGGSGNSNDPN
ncbi:MAG: Plug domain-containing protein, partial [Rhodospirillales bacterium]|nr:Plug domain-containing protein [Acetobacter sp.]